MDRQEEILFAELTKDRIDSAKTLDKPSMRGVKKSVVEKYSDQAHFIYELLQNADDAMATNAKFILEHDRLIFTHNGTRHFSISDPAFEDRDSKTGNLGDINAITSIANSNKTEASIGKFGVGFKAVFQYTSTPYVYDPHFRFRIEHLIVPIPLGEDFPERLDQETLFVFPFDHPKKDAKEAFEDIGYKLNHLSYPLLFLTNLKSISFQIYDILGGYGITVLKERNKGEITAKKIRVSQFTNSNLTEKIMWLFTSQDLHNLNYSVGFFLDKEGHLLPVNEPAFCFFPTKEVTGLSFIIHAPFLLTDSREGIRAGIPHNDDMIQRLSILAADAIVQLRDIGQEENYRLIDEKITEIIPYDLEKFSDPADKSKVSFRPFYVSIKKAFKENALLPSKEGYALPYRAYWAEYPHISQLFSNEQLAEIVQNELAKWVFPTLGHYETNRNKKKLCEYIESLTRAVVKEEAIIGGRKKEFTTVNGEKQALENIRGITPAFIEHQSVEWLHRLYAWLSDTDGRTKLSKDKPLFLSDTGKAVPAYDQKQELVLFFPVDEMDLTGYTVVHPELLKNATTKEFLKKIGVKQPSLKDQIYNIILPKYRRGEVQESDAYFLLLFTYYCKCSNEEVDHFINLIRDYSILAYYDDDGIKKLGKPDSMYLPSPFLAFLYQFKDNIRFLAYDDYKEIVGQEKTGQLDAFFARLGVKTNDVFIEVDIDPYKSGRTDLPRPKSTRNITYTETRIEGCRELLQYIIDNKDLNGSIGLWYCLLWIIAAHSGRYHSLSTILKGKCHFFYYTEQVRKFDSSDAIALRESAWICNENGEFVRPDALSRSNWPSAYLTETDQAQELFDFLGVMDIDETETEEDDSNLTDAQREKIEIANFLRENGISDISQLQELLEIKKKQDSIKQQSFFDEGKAQETNFGNPETKDNNDEYYDDIFQESDNGAAKPDNDSSTDSSEQQNVDQDESTEGKKSKLDKTTSDVVKDIIRRAKDKKTSSTSGNHSSTSGQEQYEYEDEEDQDELIPPAVDYQRKIERAKEKSAAELEKIVYFQDLQEKALNAKKYSFAWFNALLEMESLSSGELNANSREVSISFSVVEREPGTTRTLVLKYPNRYIPQFMEDLADIPLILHIGDQKKTVPIEVANIKSYTLRVKMKRKEDIEGIDLRSVNAATIDAKSPVFLIEALRKEFAELGYEDDFDMQENLPENIEFVFGPPGTGKTTYLAKEMLMPLMRHPLDCRVLVLTPTNKASDVLARRIMELSGSDHSYEKWLVRFGVTGEEDIEQSPIFKDKTFDIRTLKKCVTITTIARFPYDFFMPQGTRIFLNGINWDYIVFDEASMIPIANIVYPLYKKTPRKKFVVAGDPFQIEPITSVDLWKNENIYTLVQLDSFTNPVTVPHQYKVELLTTQYRSIPDIGEIFSRFAYGGVLEHHRTKDEQRPLCVSDSLGIKTLNIIKYPVSKYESIYRPKRLQHSSSYQIYSALFTFEYVCYLAKTIAANNPDSLFRIGIIAPYRAQADIINKLMASEKLPKEVGVEVGTIHGFQGDECDIIFVVFNTPPRISMSKEMFLNKRNIINVSISRARDYLFIVMPDDNTENIDNLLLVKRVERLIKSTGGWNQFLSPDLETLMFGDAQYLENNAFSTSHQSVNVYGLPEKCYEVRTEDTAVDVQIHKKASAYSENKNEPTHEEYENEEGLAHKTASTVEQNSEPEDVYIDSFDLDESLIPEELRDEAIDLPVRGALRGWYFLVQYEGKLRSYTAKKTAAMFIPLLRNGQVKMITVSVVQEDRIIYISKDMFKLYEQGLSDPDGIEVRRTFSS